MGSVGCRSLKSTDPSLRQKKALEAPHFDGKGLKENTVKENTDSGIYMSVKNKCRKYLCSENADWSRGKGPIGPPLNNCKEDPVSH